MTDARMAYSDGFNSPGDVSNGARHDRGLAGVVAWARADEREACAREIEAMMTGHQGRFALSTLASTAARLRAGGPTTTTEETR